MANNYCQGTLEPSTLILNDDLRTRLKAAGAEIEGKPGEEYAFFNNGLEDEDSLVPLLRDILSINPDVVFMKYQEAHFCDKLRPGEFGGIALYATRTQHVWIGSYSVNLTGGKLHVTSKVEDS